MGQQKAYDSLQALDLPFLEKHRLIESILTRGDSLELGNCFHDYAKYCYRNSKTDLAVELANRAVQIRKELDLKEPLKGSLFNLAFFYQKRNDHESAIDALKQITAILPVDRYHAKAYASMGTNYTNIGDYHNALLYQKKASSIFEKGQDTRGLYKNYMDLSLTYATLNRVQYANEILQVLATIDSLGSIISLDSRDQIIISQRRAGVYDEKGLFDVAMQHYDRALKLAVAKMDSSLIGLTLNNLAISEIKLGQMQSALKHLNEAMSMSVNINDKARVYNNLGDWFKKQDMIDSAEYAYANSVSLFATGQTEIPINNITTGHLQNTPFKKELLQALLSLADHQWRKFQTDSEMKRVQQYLITIQLGDQLIDLLRSQSNEHFSKLFWRSQAAGICMRGVKAAYQLKNIDLAYYFMERNKAILLLENLNVRNAQISAELPTKLIYQQNLLYNQMATAQLKNYERPSENSAQILNEAKLQYLEYLDSIKQHYPIYGKFLKQFQILNYQQHKDLIVNENTSTYHIIYNKHDCYALWSSSDTSILININTKILEETLNKFLEYTSKPIKTEDELSKYAHASNQLYELLFGPISNYVVNGGQLIISPDYKLHSLSFEALNSSNDPSHLKSSFLVNSAEISYAYSFSHINSDKSPNSSAGEINIAAPGRFKNRNIPTLPGSVIEGKEIATITRANFISGSLCTKERVIQLIRNSSLFHLATHASSISEIESLSTYDKNITVQELYGLPNNIDLVVLSACKTSSGKYAIGEGMISLARGFFYSGTNSVISTLSNVNDGTSATLMTSFYQNLFSGQTKSAALRNAKLDYLNKATGSAVSPCFWSSFVLIGDSDELINSQFDKNNWSISLFISGILMVLIFIYLYNRKRFLLNRND